MARRPRSVHRWKGEVRNKEAKAEAEGGTRVLRRDVSWSRDAESWRCLLQQQLYSLKPPVFFTIFH